MSDPYEKLEFRLPELEHRYGPNVHLVGTPYQLSLLATLCAQGTGQPHVNTLVRTLYAELATTVINHAFPRVTAAIPSRMIEYTPHGVYRGEVIDPKVRAVSVNVARAGTLPSQIVYDLLNTVLDPTLVRQDHLIMSRTLDSAERVVGSSIGGSKIGGDVDGAFLLFPDPMGATGGSLSTAIELYKKTVPGRIRRIACLNLIVTPEFIRRISADHPEAAIYALRLDRGLSAPDVLRTIPGERWDEERGLDDRQYIVPGGGGMGEVMNNAWV